MARRLRATWHAIGRYQQRIRRCSDEQAARELRRIGGAAWRLPKSIERRRQLTLGQPEKSGARWWFHPRALLLIHSGRVVTVLAVREPDLASFLCWAMLGIWPPDQPAGIDSQHAAKSGNRR